MTLDSFVLFFIISFFLHAFVWMLCKLSLCKNANVSFSKVICSMCVSLVSFDYLLSELFKAIVSKEDAGSQAGRIADNLGRFIIMMNVINLLASIAMSACILTINQGMKGYWCTLFVHAFLMRVVSRTMEINIAFFGDVISSKPKKSKLKAGDRILLAASSLVEESVLFAGFYFIIGEGFSNSIILGAHSIIVNLATLSQSAVATNYWYNLIPIYQLACSLILVTLCLVSYIGNVKMQQNSSNDDNDS